MVDADFDRILGVMSGHEGVVSSDTHDFDLDVSSSGALDIYLAEVSDKKKIDAAGGVSAFMYGLMAKIKPLSALRFANEKHGLGYQLKGVRLEDFFDGDNFDVDLMIETISWGRFSSQESKSRIRDFVNRYTSAGLDLMQMTCGHDFVRHLA